MQFGRFFILSAALVFARLAAQAQGTANVTSDATGPSIALNTDWSALPDEPQSQQSAPGQAKVNPPSNAEAPPSKQQPKRILGLMPNYRAVSAGTIPPAPTPKQALKIATQNSFDYSSFIFVGITSALAEWTVAHPQLGQGLPGYGRYYWRGLLDKTDGNYWVIFALPTVFHQDERYYARGHGNKIGRAS